MQLDETKNRINELKVKSRLSHSFKYKAFCMAEILTLEQMINICYEEISLSYSLYNPMYLYYKKILMKEKKDKLQQVLATVDTNEFLANQFLDDVVLSGYNPFKAGHKVEYRKEEYLFLIRDFAGELGPLVYTKYNQLLEDGLILETILESEGGVCLDLPLLDKQLILIDDVGLSFFCTLAHEIGHAIHFHQLNQRPRKNIEAGILSESIASLTEILFMEFLVKHGYNIDVLRRIFMTNFIYEAIIIHAISYALRTNRVIFKNLDLYGSDFDAEYIKPISKKPLEEMYINIFNDLDYMRCITYFYGKMAAFHILDQVNGDGKLAVEEMLNFLMASEDRSHKDNLLALGLEKTPQRLIRELKSIK